MHPIIRRRIRRATIFTIPVVATGVWSWSVLKSRRKLPPDIRFPVGSPDDLLSDQLKTGDVILFSRRWTQMLASGSTARCSSSLRVCFQPAGAILSEAKKRTFGTRFDHAAVVIMDRFGTPHVAEVTYRGVKLRRFDERILRSKSSEILLVPMNVQCDDETRAQVERHVKGMTFKTSKSLILLEMVGLLKFLANHREDEENEGSSAVGTPNESAMTKTSVGGGIAKSSSMLAILLSPFRAISFIDDSVPVSPAVQLVMSCLDRAGAVDASDISRWKPAQLLTPRDLETGAMPLRDGVEFGEILPIRINE